MPTIYLWKPNYMDKEVGHVSLKLSDGTYISHWPAEQKKKFGTVRGGSNTFYDDVEMEGRDPDETLDLSSSMLDEDDIRRWWQRYQGHYNILGNNCAQVVHKALREGGIDEYDVSIRMKFSWSLFIGLPEQAQESIVTPGDLMSFARRCKERYERGSPTSIFPSRFGGFY